MSRGLKLFLSIVVGIFAAIGLLFTAVFVAMQFGLLNVRGSNVLRNQFFTGTSTQAVAIPSQPCDDAAEKVCEWDKTPEWDVVAGGLTKDASIIARVSRETGVSGRMMAAVVIPEQIRFFTSEREVFKRYFEPLKILGSLSQFSLGVSGIKQETADQIEQFANDPASPFYPGPESAKLIKYPADTKDHEAVLFGRLTDEKDHYYSYLYTAIYIQEIESQWQNAGFDIKQSPEAVATLFNIGFDKSVPKANPEIGGAPVTLGGHVYAFGELGTVFYRSNELLDLFPR